MTHDGEFWLVYRFASHGNADLTSQLIELGADGKKLHDLEDVLEYGYVEACFRPVTTCARRDGVPVHPSDSVEELLKQGVGKCAETAIELLVDDTPIALWFTYYSVHSPEAKVSTQRVRLNQDIKFEYIAHLTNYVFDQGYLPGYYRPLVRWETQCGKKLAEDALVVDVLTKGFGVTYGKAIRIVINDYSSHPSPSTPIYRSPGIPDHLPPGMPIRPPDMPIQPPGMSNPDIPIYPPGIPTHPFPRTRTVRTVPRTPNHHHPTLSDDIEIRISVSGA